MRACRCAVRLVLLGYLLMFPILALAQTTPDVEQGMKPYGSFSGGSIDSVSLTNGNLTLHVPFYSLPQRGGRLQAGFSVIYNKLDFKVTKENCNPLKQYECDYFVGFDPNSGVGASLVYDQSVLVTKEQFDTGQVDGNGNEVYEDEYVLRTADGAVHQLAQLSGTTSRYRTIDATGYFFDLSTGYVTDPNGIRSYVGTTFNYDHPVFATNWEDSNGNQISEISGIFTDTLGRSIPESITSANISGCPQLNYPFQSLSVAQTWNFPGPNGTTMPVTLCYANVYLRTNFLAGLPNIGGFTKNELAGYNLMLESIVLPNGNAWTFEYSAADPNNSTSYAYGDLLMVTFPTHGSISYTWAAAQNCIAAPPTGYGLGRLVTSRAVNANDGTGAHTWTYTWGTQSAPGNGTLTQINTVTDPLSNDTVITDTGLGGGCSLYETQRQVYQGSQTSGSLLKTISTAYSYEADPFYLYNPPMAANVVATSVTTAWPNGQVSQIQKDYDSGFSFLDPTWNIQSTCPTCSVDGGPYTGLYGRAVAERKYDYGNGSSGALLQQTKTSYLWQSNSNYLNFNLLNLASNVSVYDGSSNLKASTNLSYDGSGRVSSGVATQHDSSPVNAPYYGNQTSVARWLNTTGTYLTTTNTLFDTGMLQKTTDPKLNTTTYTYSSSFAGAYATEIQYPTTGSVQHIVYRNYDSNTGLLVSSTDQNGNATTYSYDNMLRLTGITYPKDPQNGQQETIAITRNETSYPFSTVETKNINSSQNVITTDVFDGLGRVTQTQLNSAPGGPILVDTTYDALGRAITVSNPHTSTRQATDGLTSYTYDPLNRKTRVTEQDGSAATTIYSGNSTTVTDGAGNQRRSLTDGIGRLVEVDEPGEIPSVPATPGTGSVTITGSEQSTVINICQSPTRSGISPNNVCLQTVYDSGTVNITVNSVGIGVGYGRGSTAVSIASALAGAINADSSYPATATASSGTVNLTSKATGTASNYSLSASYTYDSTDFSAPSFTPSPSGSTLTGGTNGTSGTNTFSMSTPYQTFYSYDALGDLQQVQQHGNDSNSAHWRIRSFIYDSLSRLTNSTNPEAGTVTYTYDNDGNVATKKDGRGITITYSYDALNRVLGMTYSNGDPTVTYSYDGSSCLGQPACYNIGSRTGMTDAAGSESWSYSIMGRMEADQRTTNGVTKTTTYTYNADGSLLTLTYPTGRAVTYAYDNAGRPQSGIDQANSINYAEAATYAPQGALASMVLGQGGSFGGINLSESYTDRLQPNELKASSSAGTVIDLSYCFYALVSGACPTTATNDNGNVIAIFNNLNSGRTQTFAYDALNRISTAQTQGTTGSNCFGFQFAYDGWANLTATSILSGYTSCSATTPDAFGISVDGNNHLTTSGFTYDSSGNVLTDGVNTYAWNAESETKTAQGVTYTYDGLGNRVEKSNGTLYWYGPGGEVLDETNLTGSLTNEYVFFAGKRVARRDASGNIYYYAEDFIGSSRVITQSNGTLCSDADFLPFGQEVDYTSACGQNYKFEGKERDIETGNDNFGARYYRSALGRWMSPDWSAIPAAVPYANLTNPQTLNLYAMTSDNPETFADLDGHSGILAMIADPGGSLSPDMETGSDAFTDGTTTVITDGTPPPEPQQPTTPPQSPTSVTAQQQNTSTVVVEQVKGEGGNALGHVAIGVNGATPVGLVPDSDKAAIKALAKEVASAANGTPETSPVPGHVESLASNRAIKAKATIHVTPQQAAAMQAAIKGMAGHQMYDPAYRNCASFVEEVLRSGGVKAPNDITPGGLVGDLNKQFPQ